MTLPLIVAITGATGVVYGVEALRALKQLNHPTHLILSESAVRNFQIETDLDLNEIKAFADVVHSNKNVGASTASGSFKTKGMLVAPCSIKSLSSIANSYNDNLITRSADVCLKERRRLVLMVRETPLHKGHLDLMSRCADLGAVILPPMPAFYHGPQTIMDLIRQSVGKALDQFDIEHDLFHRWSGKMDMTPARLKQGPAAVE
ncbi:MAG: UbiX family flavin prenyltransferase [Zoogloeaceae bacterium]|jgi:4-hydroxy-3-polyprenylbenzoate decarboxylase|nr:UbiX family flavin prenyltransferase [Zoogloeaceae bacterium]